MIRYSASLYLFILFESTGKTSKDLEWSSHWGSKQINAGVVINILWCYTLHMAHRGTVKYVNKWHWLFETLFDIAFCTFAPCGKTNIGFSSDHQKSMHSCHGSPRYSQKFFLSVIVDPFYLFLNTFAQWKQTQWCHQKGFPPAHAKTFRVENFKAQGKISEKKTNISFESLELHQRCEEHTGGRCYQTKKTLSE